MSRIQLALDVDDLESSVADPPGPAQPTVDLAKKIATTQTVEIDTMKDLLS